MSDVFQHLAYDSHASEPDMNYSMPQYSALNDLLFGHLRTCSVFGLLLGFVLSLPLSQAYAQTQEQTPNTTVETVKETADQNSAKETADQDSKSVADKSLTSKELKNRAAKEEFERVKEERLNDLRYKHLWIAYSLVWLIIFVFIRGTWRRSQAVEENVKSLQSRLEKLESQSKN